MFTLETGIGGLDSYNPNVSYQSFISWLFAAFRTNLCQELQQSLKSSKGRRLHNNASMVFADEVHYVRKVT
jgi:hypothetical protein